MSSVKSACLCCCRMLIFLTMYVYCVFSSNHEIYRGVEMNSQYLQSSISNENIYIFLYTSYNKILIYTGIYLLILASLFVNVFGILQAWQTVLSPPFWGDIVFLLCVQYVCPSVHTPVHRKSVQPFKMEFIRRSHTCLILKF